MSVGLLRTGSESAKSKAVARTWRAIWTCAFALALAASAKTQDSAPAVARLHLAGNPRGVGGLIFFIPVGSSGDVAAVGSAHSLELDALAQVGSVEFRRGPAHRPVASSRGFLVSPGRPFRVPGGRLGDDFAVFALDAPPEGARVLEPAPATAIALDTRVHVLGVPVDAGQDDLSLSGRVVGIGSDRIEVELDADRSLSGWGGAPVVSDAGVIGILQAQWRSGSGGRLSVAPIAGVLEALEHLLRDGAGEPFAHFAARTPPAAPSPGWPTIPSTRTESPSTRVNLELEVPLPGSRVGDGICGLFVAGRALAHSDRFSRFNVVLVIDRSESTREASGADIDGDGDVAAARLGPIGSLFAETDLGDSILAAEIAAARQLLLGFDPRITRVGVVSFAGKPNRSRLFRPGWTPAARVRQSLTADYARVEDAFQAILDAGPEGATNMAAAIERASDELVGSGDDPDRKKVVLFFTDGKPTLPYWGFEADNVRAVLRAAESARRDGIRIHSFAIGPDALAGPIAALEMARETGGSFTPVRHPGDLESLVQEVTFTQVRSVTLSNATTGDPGQPVQITADGGWAGFVPTVPGPNRIEVVAHAADGNWARLQLEVTVEAKADEVAPPVRLAARRNRLLENCLRSAKSDRRSAELRHAEFVRRELSAEIEQERRKASTRAAQQRLELQLEVEEKPRL